MCINSVSFEALRTPLDIHKTAPSKHLPFRDVKRKLPPEIFKGAKVVEIIGFQLKKIVFLAVGH